MGVWIGIGSVAALVTAIVTLFTVLELRAQRRGMYRPDLALLRAEIVGHRDEKGAVYFANSYLVEKTDGYNPCAVSVELVNVGLGCCKNLTTLWQYNILDFCATIKRMDSTDSFRLLYENDWLQITLRETKMPIMHNVKVQNVDKHSYVVPIGVHPQPTRLEIPNSYLDLLRLWLLLVFSTDAEKRASPPPLRILLQYQDIGNQTMKQEFEVRPVVNMFTAAIPSEKGTLVCMDGYFDPIPL